MSLLNHVIYYKVQELSDTVQINEVPFPHNLQPTTNIKLNLSFILYIIITF